MTAPEGNPSGNDQSRLDEVISSMLTDSLGFEMDKDTRLSPEQVFSAAVEIYTRIEVVADQLEKKRLGEEYDKGILADTEAVDAIYLRLRERRNNATDTQP